MLVKNIVWKLELLTTQLGFYGHLGILAGVNPSGFVIWFRLILLCSLFRSHHFNLVQSLYLFITITSVQSSTYTRVQLKIITIIQFKLYLLVKRFSNYTQYQFILFLNHKFLKYVVAIIHCLLQKLMIGHMCFTCQNHISLFYVINLSFDKTHFTCNWIILGCF